MKALLRFVALAAALAAPAVFAQAATPVQQTGSHLDTCSVVHTDQAVNAVATLTLPACTGSTPNLYVCGVDLQVSNDATGAVVSSNLKFTSTNLGGWAYVFSAANAANSQGLDKSITFPTTLRASSSATAVTIVSPAANLHATYSITGYYYCAP